MIDHLLEGNERFRRGRSQQCGDRVAQRLACVDTQSPSVAILSCADARVDPDVVFDTALGEVFSVRVAGGLATDEAIASLRYAVDALGVRTVVVLGHEGCGAVAAAVADGDAPDGLAPLVDPIRRAIDGAPGTEPVRRNTCVQAGRVHEALRDRANVLAAVYAPSSGAVHIHDVVAELSPPGPAASRA